MSFVCTTHKSDAQRRRRCAHNTQHIRGKVTEKAPVCTQHTTHKREGDRGNTLLASVLCTGRLTASMVDDADGVIYVKLTVKIVSYAVNRQSFVTVTPLYTIIMYGAIFE